MRVEYIEFEGEQHGFRKAQSIVRSLEAELAFYGEVFGFTPAALPDQRILRQQGVPPPLIRPKLPADPFPEQDAGAPWRARRGQVRYALR